jgi:hypothetical protein
VVEGTLLRSDACVLVGIAPNLVGVRNQHTARKNGDFMPGKWVTYADAWLPETTDIDAGKTTSPKLPRRAAVHVVRYRPSKGRVDRVQPARHAPLASSHACASH